MSPSSDQYGTVVVISGTKLLEASHGTKISTVRLAGVAATIVSGSS